MFLECEFFNRIKLFKIYICKTFRLATKFLENFLLYDLVVIVDSKKKLFYFFKVLCVFFFVN